MSRSGRKAASDGLRRRSGRAVAAAVEHLETRTLLSAYNPMNVRSAYGFNRVNFTDGAGNVVQGDGSGQTVAIVDAYDAPTLFSDVNSFDRAWRLDRADTTSPSYYDAYGDASTFLTKATPQGTPANDVGWSQETLLDVQWAHATAPRAKILLVEAKSASNNDLLAAVDYARNQPGVSVVSMSWGQAEFSTERNYDSHFTTPANHIGGYDAQGNPILGGITFVAASGDTGAQTLWPAVSPNVVAVGGTALRIDTSTFADAYVSESGWSGSGGGVSAYEPKPSYQSGVTQSATRRTSPDVAYDADPNTGFYVYDTNGYGGWTAVGGTSAGAPQWASLIAVANQGRAIAGNGSLDGASQTLPALYGLDNSTGGYFHDITTGSTSYRKNKFSATKGYDLVTGLGSPIPGALAQALLAPASYGAAAPVAGGTVATAPAVQPAVVATPDIAWPRLSIAPIARPIAPAQLRVQPAGDAAAGMVARTDGRASASHAYAARRTSGGATTDAADNSHRSTNDRISQLATATAARNTPLTVAVNVNPKRPVSPTMSMTDDVYGGRPTLAAAAAAPAFAVATVQADGVEDASVGESIESIKAPARTRLSTITTAGVAILVGCWYTAEAVRQRAEDRSRNWLEGQAGRRKIFVVDPDGQQ